MPVLNYTTSIPAWKTVGEVEFMLMQHGAKTIIKQYKDNRIESLIFSVEHQGREVPVRLPVRVPQVLEAMKRDKKEHPKTQYKLTLEQAEKVAWRQIRDWIEVQLQMVELEQMTMLQIFLPCIQDCNGQTLYERLESNDFLLAGPADEVM